MELELKAGLPGTGGKCGVNVADSMAISGAARGNVGDGMVTVMETTVSKDSRRRGELKLWQQQRQRCEGCQKWIPQGCRASDSGWDVEGDQS